MTSKGIAIIPGNMPEIMVKRIIEEGFRVYESAKLSGLDERIAYHTDIQCNFLPNGDLMVAPILYDYYKEVLVSEGIKIVKGKFNPKSPYPFEVAYNIKVFDDFIMGKVDYIDPYLLEAYRALKMEIIEVKQGYVGCSILTDGKAFAVSSDKNILKILRAKGLEILELSRGDVLLPGYKEGFVGGASGFHDNTEYFTGRFKGKRQSQVEEFLCKFVERIVYLSDDEIVDLGGIFFRR